MLKKASGKAAGSEGAEAYVVCYVEANERLRTQREAFSSDQLKSGRSAAW